MSIHLRLLHGLAMEARMIFKNHLIPMIFLCHLCQLTICVMFDGVQVDGLGVVKETAIEAGSW